jgi:hypothetical protein
MKINGLKIEKNLNNKGNKSLVFLILSVGFLNNVSSEQVISPNGYSGLGIVPNANVLKGGTAVLSHDPTVPGAPIIRGYNTQIGFGLTDNLELVGRLATNNQKCNLFEASACPPSSYRDFSSSMKWSLPIDWLKANNAALAVGATDFGGAATYFRSYYVVGTKSFEQFDVTLGQAKRGNVGSSMLDGTMASATWRPKSWANVSLQKVGQSTSAHASIQMPLFSDGSTAWLTFNHRISEAPVMDKNWIGWGLSMPLDRVEKVSVSSTLDKAAPQTVNKALVNLTPSDLPEALKDRGFYNPKIGTKANGTLVLELENTSYSWNILDAAGVALGALSSAYAQETREQDFELVITTRGIKQLKVTGGAKCVGLWLSKGEVCSKLAVQSLSQRSADTTLLPASLGQLFGGLDDAVNWTSGSAWSLRPEIIISPTVVTTIGTELGSIDGDMGANINAVIPLWAGATVESNRVKPLGVGTKQFEQGGLFYASRIKPVTNRTLFHQLINLPLINTQARLSSGTAYSVWDGRQIETSTQTDNGRHKLGFTAGTFKNEGPYYSNERKYRLMNYRFANNDQQTSVTEVTHGKFWAGDKGFIINQRFWHGDTTLNIYFRRTRMSETQPLVSFAGIQFAIPFTPRENKSLEYLGVRGVSQWTYSLETKVLEKDNILTGGFGEVPKVGDSLVMTFNRDRNSNRYYDTNLGRMKNAYVNLGND